VGGSSGIADALRVTEAALAALGPVPALERAALDLEVRAGHVDAALARLDRHADSRRKTARIAGA
jgi:hypothetical protein